MFSVEMLRTSVPPLGEAPPANADAEPATVGFNDERLALFEMGAPSRMMAVPSPFRSSLAVTELTWRMLICCAEFRLGLVDRPPGSSDIRSLRLVACRWSMAVREIEDEVALPASFEVAVTTISLILKFSSCRLKSRRMSCVTFTKVSMGSLPR